MVKLKYRFTTWANCKYYHVISNGKKLDLNVIISPKDRFGNQEVEIEAQGAEMTAILLNYSSDYSAGGFLKYSCRESCMKALKEIAERIA